MMTIKELYNTINNLKPARSAWGRGVQFYAGFILESIMDYAPDNITSVFELKNICLNGAESWKQYAAGGGGLVYDGYIAEALCTPSELKRLKYKEGGYKNPNKNENWIDAESRALYQAWLLIRDTATAEEV